ncbi:MAG: prepilin peptidase [Sulfurovum sp.]|nr:prepilin peptidase [Sulfurovum sp.]
MEPLIANVLVFIFGMMLGSFLNVVIYRTPRNESIAFPSSHCTSCDTKLKWYHNIPIFSWLSLGGRCAFCKKSISKQYPIVEILTAFLWLGLFYKLGAVWYFPFVAASFTALLALTVIDIKYYAVPDSINFFALLMAVIQPDILKLEWSNPLVSAIFAAGGLWLLAKIIAVLMKKEAMGGADVIVAGTMAALLGFPGFFLALFLSAILAIIPSLFAKDTMVPFVPFLALATLIVYLFDTQTSTLLHWIMYG